jgi:hypothetical protein
VQYHESREGSHQSPQRGSQDHRSHKRHVMYEALSLQRIPEKLLTAVQMSSWTHIAPLLGHVKALSVPLVRR